MDDLLKALLIILAVGVAAVILIKIGGWLVNWARNAIKRAIRGAKNGILTLVENFGEIIAYAIGNRYGELEVVEEITVDEDDLSEDVLEAIRRHQAVSEKIHV